MQIKIIKIRIAIDIPKGRFQNKKAEDNAGEYQEHIRQAVNRSVEYNGSKPGLKRYFVFHEKRFQRIAGYRAEGIY